MESNPQGCAAQRLKVVRYQYVHVIVELWLYLLLFNLAAAECECGYSTSIHGTSHVFTDLLESDFVTLDDISLDTDWVRQAFNVSSERARGDFGEMFMVENVVSASTSGADRGLELMVQSQNVEDMVPVAEIASNREDLLWGTFRASMKLTSTPGTCAAFFWYYNDTEEIDMEFLSKDFNTANNSYPVNLVLQSREAAKAGYDAQQTGNFIKTYLPFNPTADFHEYRIDFLPGTVLFYANGQLLGQMNGSAVPTSAGHLILQHWSNGNPLWSGGPPEQDAVLTVKYVKAYFNSSSPARIQDSARRCRQIAAPGSVCTIPEITASNSTPEQFFFSNQSNMTNNQTVYGSKNAALRLFHPWSVLLGVSVLAGGYVLGFW